MNNKGGMFMNDLETFIQVLINLNSKDELIIEEEKFFNNDDIKNIIKKYKFDKEKRKNLYQFSNYILKIKNQKLQKLNQLYNCRDIDELVFSNLVLLEGQKIEFFCSLFIRYLSYDINYKKLNNFINILKRLKKERILFYWFCT